MESQRLRSRLPEGGFGPDARAARQWPNFKMDLWGTERSAAKLLRFQIPWPWAPALSCPCASARGAQPEGSDANRTAAKGWRPVRHPGRCRPRQTGPVPCCLASFPVPPSFCGAVTGEGYYCGATLYHGYLSNLMHSAERVEYKQRPNFEMERSGGMGVCRDVRENLFPGRPWLTHSNPSRSTIARRPNRLGSWRGDRD